MRIQRSPHRFSRAAVAASIAVIAVTGLVATPAAAGTPVATVSSATTSTVPATAAAGRIVAAVGDGAWSPSHQESTRVIPLCKGPVAVAKWLKVNFSDHGRDIDNYIKRNGAVLTSLASGKTSAITTTILLTQAVLQIPSYAVSDAVFHLPATTLSLATGCGIIAQTGVNPFRALK